MPKAKAFAGAIDVGEQLAEEALGRRRAAQKRRIAAIRAAKPELAGVAAAAWGSAGASTGTLIAEGDSWFDYPFNDVLKTLEDEHGFEVESVSKAGDRVEDMAYSGGQLDEFARKVEKSIRQGVVPKAILLSGGGNDIAGKIELGMLLNHAGSSISGLNEKVVDGVINERLITAYTTIISSITSVCLGLLDKRIPIIVHGYDYAVPDGRGVMGGFWALPGPWLEPAFRQKGYKEMQQCVLLVQNLIDRFNDMLAMIARNGQFSHVHYLDLRQTLPNGPGYRTWWGNELHPNKKGFKAVSAKFADLIAQLPSEDA